MENLLYPVLRKAEFSQPREDLEKGAAKLIAENIQGLWELLSQKYISRIKKIIETDSVWVDADENLENESILREEGFSAFIVDNPVISAQWKSYVFQIRTTIAVCHKGASTKNWTRVSLLNPIKKDNDSILELNKVYDKIAAACCKISHNEFRNVVKSVQEKEPKALGDFTIMTFGVRDKKLGEYLDLFDDVDLKFKEFYNNYNEGKELIEDYYISLFDKSPNELFRENENNFWINTTSGVINDEGYVDSNNVLYKVKRNKKSIFAFGLGSDESKDGILANRSSLKVAKFYAKTI